MIARRRKAAAAALGLFLAGSFEAPRWQFRAPVTVTPGAAISSARLTVDVLTRSAPDLRDLRLVRNGEETPFVVQRKTGSSVETEVPAELIDKEVQGGALRVTLDFGLRAKHSRIRIQTTRQNFRQRVKLESSPDNRQWAAVREDAWIFNFHQDGRDFTLTEIDYPASTRRYLRAWIYGWTEPDALTGVSAVSRRVEPAERSVVASVEPQLASDAQSRTSLYSIDLKIQGMPYDRLLLEAGESFFHRAVELETSSDSKQWRWLAGVTLYRLPDDARLAIGFPESRDRYLRLRVFNRDNRPIVIQRVTFESINRYIQFSPQLADSYYIYFGSTQARTPVYDLPVILARLPGSPAAAEVGKVEENPAFRPPPEPRKPWTDRYPALLYAVLGTAVLGMGYIAVRFLRKVLAAPVESPPE
jgi:hypothetical protein